MEQFFIGFLTAGIVFGFISFSTIDKKEKKEATLKKLLEQSLKDIEESKKKYQEETQYLSKEFEEAQRKNKDIVDELQKSEEINFGLNEKLRSYEDL